jgi:hypothetical protein
MMGVVRIAVRGGRKRFIRGAHGKFGRRAER